MKNLKVKTVVLEILIFSVLIFGAITTQAQVGIGIMTADPSAQLDVVSTTKGFLPPRMTTTERDSISTPATGLVIFNTTTNSLEYKSSTGWVSLTTATAVNYPSVLIGAQYWMTHNLDVSTYRNGVPIPYVSDTTIWGGLTYGAWCYYNNDPANGEIYGKLYNWYAVNDLRGLAPTGWHVPSRTEWLILISNLDGPTAAGGRMKLADTTIWTSLNTGADNSSGFVGLPGGRRFSDGSFNYVGSEGHWWSTQGDGVPFAWYLSLYDNSTGVSMESNFKKSGFSVRCLRD